MEINEKFNEGNKDISSNPYFVAPTGFFYPENIKGRVLDTYKNLEWLLKKFNIELRFNKMNRQREISIPGHYIFEDDLENSALAKVNYLATLNGMPTKQLDKHLDALAHINAYHPIQDCIKSKPWDGQGRLQFFLQTLKTTDDDLAKKLITTWMISAIAAAFSEHGFASQGVLVLQGKQSLGKTRFVKSLDPINCSAIKEGAILDLANKDSIMLISRHWIVELGELDATLKKSDIARLKSFITSDIDDIRIPHAPKITRFPRRTVFIATVNDAKFLADDTGNRRWWTITVNEIDLNHGLDMQQIWAEVYYLWNNGALPYLSSDLQATVNESNIEYEKVDPFKELLQSEYDWESAARRWTGATQVLIELGFNKPTRSDSTRMGMLLKEFSKENSKKLRGQTLYSCPHRLFKSG